jgi:NAD(P)-dependent dehydrogenase (short-subunit alcohol dehydrogenase family)
MANEVSLQGKTAIVTGGSRGLGLGIVEALVQRKARAESRHICHSHLSIRRY